MQSLEYTFYKNCEFPSLRSLKTYISLLTNFLYWNKNKATSTDQQESWQFDTNTILFSLAQFEQMCVLTQTLLACLHDF